MSVAYDVFKGAFLAKITDFDLADMDDSDISSLADGYLIRALVKFTRVCKYDLASARDDENRVFNIDIADNDLDEIVDILSEGMVVQWLKPYVYRQEALENVLNTKDYTTYSPAELLMRIGNAYQKAQNDYKQMVLAYSYHHGDLSKYHL